MKDQTHRNLIKNLTRNTHHVFWSDQQFNNKFEDLSIWIICLFACLLCIYAIWKFQIRSEIHFKSNACFWTAQKFDQTSNVFQINKLTILACYQIDATNQQYELQQTCAYSYKCAITTIRDACWSCRLLRWDRCKLWNCKSNNLLNYWKTNLQNYKCARSC